MNWMPFVHQYLTGCHNNRYWVLASAISDDSMYLEIETNMNMPRPPMAKWRKEAKGQRGGCKGYIRYDDTVQCYDALVYKGMHINAPQGISLENDRIQVFSWIDHHNIKFDSLNEGASVPQILATLLPVPGWKRDSREGGPYWVPVDELQMREREPVRMNLPN